MSSEAAAIGEAFALSSNGVDTGFRLTFVGKEPDGFVVHLISTATGEYLGADAIRLRTYPEPKPFILRASGRDVTLQARAQWIAYHGSFVLWATPHAFQLSQLAEPTRSCCCGVGGDAAEAGIAWDDRRHKQILLDAVDVVKATIGKTGSNAVHAKAFRDEYWGTNKELSAFGQKVADGLYDADYKDEYTGVLAGKQIYYKHFYDPDKRSTFYGYTENAMTEFCRHFYASIDRRERQDMTGAGYSLGLALHYLTDLTQPMHAANFINNPLSGDYRHSVFEERAESTAYDFDVSGIDISTYDVSSWRSLGQIITEVARFSKDLFKAHVDEVAERKVLWIDRPDGASYIRYLNSWTDEEAKPIVSRAFPFAVKTTAALLVYWTGISTYAFVDALYTRVLGRAPRSVDESGLRTWGGYLRDGRTMQWIVRQVALGPESIGGIEQAGSVDDQIRVLYHRLLARGCGEPDLAAWRGAVSAKRYAETVNAIIDSAEYDQRFGPHILPH
jgi:hypothetical protein